MKRLILFAATSLLLAATLPALAQDGSNIITLNDATPSIDVAIALPANTTGAIALDFAGAAVLLTDDEGTPVFRAADPRLHGIELNIAPNTGNHTLTVTRLPGTTEALVRVRPQPQLTTQGIALQVSGSTIALNQEVDRALVPGQALGVSVAAEDTTLLTTSFPATQAATRMVDTQNNLLAASTPGHVDGFNLVLDSGDYLVTMLGSQAGSAQVRAVPASVAGVSILAVPTTITTVANVEALPCTASVVAETVNLRSGPGTVYSQIGTSPLNEQLPVGGRNVENNWLLVGTNVGSAWVSQQYVRTQGDCDSLPTYNIPLQDAQPTVLVSSDDASDDDDEWEHERYSEHEHEFEGEDDD